ncbi:hypothetical protein [Streptomyces sp. NPDC047939]|uniref:hypothetical protein n=1 Tax=Streptomyces sp. NPDC047939 TaxID=3155381 RepID=UPI0034218431
MPDVPVVRAEAYYLPPPPRRGQIPQDWSQIPGAELVYHWLNYRMGRRMPIPTEFVPDAAPVYARINQNRWIGDCPVCGNAAIISLNDPRFGCTECPRDWVELILPADPLAVEAEMLAIPQTYLRNWWADDDPSNPTVPPAEPVEGAPPK